MTIFYPLFLVHCWVHKSAFKSNHTFRRASTHMIIFALPLLWYSTIAVKLAHVISQTCDLLIGLIYSILIGTEQISFVFYQNVCRSMNMCANLYISGIWPKKASLTLKRRKIFWVILTEYAPLCPHTVSLPEPACFGAYSGILTILRLEIIVPLLWYAQAQAGQPCVDWTRSNVTTALKSMETHSKWAE